MRELLAGWDHDLEVRVIPGPGPAAPKRNAGAMAATGEILAFLDDDTRPEPGWVEGMLGAFERGARAVGGRVVPEFEAPLPAYLTGREHVVRGFNALGEWRRESFVIGCNIAFRREVFETVGLFSPDFGRKGRRYNTGDETEFVRRVTRRFEVIYCEEAGVRHAIQARRLERGYLYGRSWWAARAIAGIDELHRPGFTRNVWSVALLLPVLAFRALRSPASVAPRLRVIHGLSYVVEGLRIRLGARGEDPPVPRLTGDGVA